MTREEKRRAQRARANATFLLFALFLLLVGLIYIIETLSDILQIVYFKLTHGKRIFKMSPIHHHFEMCGWSEVRIDATFAFITLIGVLLGFVYIYLN